MTVLGDRVRSEFLLIGETDEDYISTMVDIVERFGVFGRSDFDKEKDIDVITKLLRQESLSPLTTSPSEWYRHPQMIGTDVEVWQNIRNVRAFSNDGGKTYYLSNDLPASGLRQMYTSVVV